MTDPPHDRRPKYDSPVRREQVAAMRRRIVSAGCELLHGFPVWNWNALTVPAVAAHAGITPRTVYRYFPSERDLRDAVMEQLEQEAEVVLEGLQLEHVAEVAARIIRHSSTFEIRPRVPRDPTVAATNARQREALMGAIKPLTPDWTERERAIAGGMLDVLWSVMAYERLVTDWDLDLAESLAGTTWVIRLVEAAIRADQRPDDLDRPPPSHDSETDDTDEDSQ